jgi:hypothetical protein
MLGRNAVLAAALQKLPGQCWPSRRLYAATVPTPSQPLSALPSPAARVLAFVAILFGGLAGGTIGYLLVKLQCSGECATGRGIGAFIGAVVAAGGMSIVAILVLRATGEWRDIQARERAAGRTL